MLEIGIKGEGTRRVTEADTAQTIKSGTLPVFATPALAALVEETAWKSVAAYLEEGEGTVGGSLSLKHLAPTLVGTEVTCRTKLVRVEGAKLFFHAEVWDAVGKIGEAEHLRFLINETDFMEKARERKA